MQQTSLQAYIKLSEQYINKKQRTIYETIKNNEPISNYEISQIIKIPINTITPRTLELRKKGLVTKAGTKKNEKTNKMMIIWKTNQQT